MRNVSSMHNRARYPKEIHAGDEEDHLNCD